MDDEFVSAEELDLRDAPPSPLEFDLLWLRAMYAHLGDPSEW